MNSYDEEFHSPPAPMARVALGRADTDARIESLRMLIDSGADLTVLPGIAIQELGIDVSEARAFEVEGYGGKRSQLPIVEAVLLLEGFKFRGEYLVDDAREIGVLGRNILNSVIVELHGPTRSWLVRR